MTTKPKMTAAERRDRDAQRKADYDAWAARNPPPAFMVSRQHIHDESCWDEPQWREMKVGEKQGNVWVNVLRKLYGVRCRATGAFQEQPRP